MRTLLVGSLIFLLITVFEQVPILGWLGFIVSVVAWIWLGRQADIAGSPISGGLVGAVTGFVGALSAWIAQIASLFGSGSTEAERLGAGFGIIGASVGLLYWPVVGAIVCALAAGSARKREPVERPEDIEVIDVTPRDRRSDVLDAPPSDRPVEVIDVTRRDRP